MPTAAVTSAHEAGATKPPWVHARVVKACAALSPMTKLIWLEHYGLANGRQGATISASSLARRIGVSRVTVERARKELLRIDLFKKRDRGNGRTASWFVQLPSCARPQAERLIDDDVERYAELLSDWIKSHPPTSPKDEGGLASGTSRISEGGWAAEGEPHSSHEGGFHSMASHLR